MYRDLLLNGGCRVPKPIKAVELLSLYISINAIYFINGIPFAVDK